MSIDSLYILRETAKKLKRELSPDEFASGYKIIKQHTGKSINTAQLIDHLKQYFLNPNTTPSFNPKSTHIASNDDLDIKAVMSDLMEPYPLMHRSDQPQQSIKFLTADETQVSPASSKFTQSTNAESEQLIVPTSNQIDSLFGIRDTKYIQRFLTPSAAYKRVCILLDTNNIDTSLSSGNKFVWNFLPNTDVQTGTVNAVGRIRDLIGMRVFPIKANFTSPPSTTYPFNNAGNITLQPKYFNNYINPNNNFTILIHEFEAQCFVGRDGRKFHFVFFPTVMNLINNREFKIIPAEPYIEYLTSGKGNGWFWFRTPITSFSTLTMTMANPFETISLSKNVRTLVPIELIYLNDAIESEE